MLWKPFALSTSIFSFLLSDTPPLRSHTGVEYWCCGLEKAHKWFKPFEHTKLQCMVHYNNKIIIMLGGSFQNEFHLYWHHSYFIYGFLFFPHPQRQAQHWKSFADTTDCPYVFPGLAGQNGIACVSVKIKRHQCKFNFGIHIRQLAVESTTTPTKVIRKEKKHS